MLLLNKIKNFWSYCFVLIFIKIILFSGFPICARSYNIHDDYLMIQNAIYLLKGEWLGPYSQMTLIKGIGYPLFLVGAYLMHMPILMAQILFHAGACLLFIYVLSAILKNKYKLYF